MAMEEGSAGAAAALSCALDLGEAMLAAGAEVYRVEDTISRICRAYGMERTDPFVIPNCIIVSARTAAGETVTQTRRVRSGQTDLRLVDRLNQLSRDLCLAPSDPAEAAARIAEEIRPRKERFPWQLLGSCLTAGGFSAFFGGTWRDALATAAAACLVVLLQKGARRSGVNGVLTALVCSAAVAACAFALVGVGAAQHVDKIVIGGIMLLVPGVELTNSMRDMMAGDIVAALMHLTEALFLAVGIAVGSAGILALLGGLLS